MLGNKFSLIFWDKPKDDGIDWRIQISGGGDIILNGLVLESKENFEMTFDDAFSYDTIVILLKKLGFTPKESQNEETNRK